MLTASHVAEYLLKRRRGARGIGDTIIQSKATCSLAEALDLTL